jgi:hypothetical protein
MDPQNEQEDSNIEELDDTQELETQEEADENEAEGQEEGEGAYKIGDQSFKTSEEAFAFANSLVHQNAITEAQSNAYPPRS